MNETVSLRSPRVLNEQFACEYIKRVAAVILALALLALSTIYTVKAMAADANPKPQTIAKAGSQASVKGPGEYFTGTVRVDPLFAADESINASGAYVTFEPGARSAWHKPPGRAAPDRYVRRRPHRHGGRPHRGDQGRGRGHLSPRREALARRFAHHGHDPHRHHRDRGRQERRVDGEGHGRAVQR